MGQKPLRRPAYEGDMAMEAKKVKDLMIPLGHYAHIDENATLYDAVVALEEARNKHEGGIYPYRAVLVTSKSGRVIGKLSLLDLLRSLEPKYGEMGDLREVMGSGFHAEFLRSTIAAYDLWKTPLDELCRKAVDLNVGVITKSPLEGEVIDVDASLNEGIHQLIMGRHQSLLVTSEGELVGILRLTDVFVEVGKRIKASRC
jgi:CBS domain-containing protein